MSELYDIMIFFVVIGIVIAELGCIEDNCSTRPQSFEVSTTGGTCSPDEVERMTSFVDQIGRSEAGGQFCSGHGSMKTFQTSQCRYEVLSVETEAATRITFSTAHEENPCCSQSFSINFKEQ